MTLNREVINKYKHVFEWWLSGGGFWARQENSNKWEHIKSGAPTLVGWIYVQDDKFQEYRKAQKDGACIIIRTSLTRDPFWKQLDFFNRSDITEMESIDFSETDNYRINSRIDKNIEYFK